MILQGQYCHLPKKGNRYCNTAQEREVSALTLLKQYFSTALQMPVVEAPSDYRFPRQSLVLHPAYPTARWIGHSTFLIEIDGVNILTDPVWSERCSALSFFGPKRTHVAPCSLDELPQINYVLISHNHFDHLDSNTVKALNQRFPDIVWIVPVGLRSFLEKRGVAHIVQLKWWQQKELQEGIVVTAVPAQHFSGRSIFDLNKSHWCGFVLDVLRNNGEIRNFYFAGDTGYNELDFKEIGKRWNGIDLALIPIDAHKPIMKQMHATPSDAVQIHCDIKAKLSLSMHWKTFESSENGHNRASYELQQALNKASVPEALFRVLDPGQAINW